MEYLSDQELKDTLRGWLGPRGVVEVSRDDPDGRITGWIIHPDFTGVSRMVRQGWLWDGIKREGELPNWPGLRAKFGDRSSQIGLVLTYSPIEYANSFGELAVAA